MKRNKYAKKLDEAAYFLGLIRKLEDKNYSETKNELDEITYNLSAFLSAGRTVLQYLIKHTKDRAWLNTQLTDPIISFMREARNENIHRSPIAPAFEGDSLADGMMIVGTTAKQGPMIEFVKYHSSFINWEGPEGVAELCAVYLEMISQVTQEAILSHRLSDSVLDNPK